MLTPKRSSISDIPSSTHPFQTSFDDTLKSSSEDTCSSDNTWEQKNLGLFSKVNMGQALQVFKVKKLKAPIFQAKSRSSSKSLLVPKLSSSKVVQVDVGASAGSSTLLVATKRPPPMRNYTLGIAVVKTWKQILNKKFRIKKPKEMLEQLKMLPRKGKGRWCRSSLLITEYLVNISKRRAFWSLNDDILKITILKTNTSYPSRKIRQYSEEEVTKTMAKTMEQYMSKTRVDYGSGVVRPKIEYKDNFELKGQFLKELRTNTFNGSDHEDANEHAKKVLEIVDLFHIPNITIDQVMLRAFPMSLTGAASRWLRN
ncbi:hypothetical protein Tco_0400810 [Tanacetum coccineum]